MLTYFTASSYAYLQVFIFISLEDGESNVVTEAWEAFYWFKCSRQGCSGCCLSEQVQGVTRGNGRKAQSHSRRQTNDELLRSSIMIKFPGLQTPRVLLTAIQVKCEQLSWVEEFRVPAKFLEIWPLQLPGNVFSPFLASLFCSRLGLHNGKVWVVFRTNFRKIRFTRFRYVLSRVLLQANRVKCAKFLEFWCPFDVNSSPHPSRKHGAHLPRHSCRWRHFSKHNTFLCTYIRSVYGLEFEISEFWSNSEGYYLKLAIHDAAPQTRRVRWALS